MQTTSVIKGVQRNVLIASGFGTLALLFGQVQFNIPGLEGNVTSLNEIPSLISVFYLTNPVYLLLLSFISSLGTPAEGSAVSTFVFHVIGLFPFWFYYHHMIRGKELTANRVFWRVSIGVIIYYLVLLIPVMIVTNNIIGIGNDKFGPVYLRIVKSASFELVATTIITGLFVLQWNANNRLKDHLSELEEKVRERTRELDSTIDKLNKTNAELASVNDKLDQMVKARTQELEVRNIQLTGYAFINSHLLRAPIARLLGLSTIMKNELKFSDDSELIDKFLLTCNELDQIVKLMSELLNEESILSTQKMEELRYRIRKIAEEINDIA